MTEPSPPMALTGVQQRAASRVKQREPAIARTASTRRTPTPPSHARFAKRLLTELAKRDPDGSALKFDEAVAQAVAIVADRVLDPAAVWQEQLGAFYDTDGVRRLLARDGEPVTRQAVHKRKGLLALPTGSGQAVFPAFQFRGRTPAPGLDRVLAELPVDLVSRWTVASWLVTPEAELDGGRPIDLLFTGRAAADQVVQVARHWAAALAA